MFLRLSRASKACHYPNFCTKWMFTSSACGAGDRIKPCLYPHFDAFLARGCGRQNRAWGGASAEPQVYGVSTYQARGAGGSFLSCFIIIEIGPMAVARSAGLCDKS